MVETNSPSDSNGHAHDEKGTDRGKHPKRGLGRWLQLAPEGTPHGEVIHAWLNYDSPSDAWPQLDEEADADG